jgi:hypothetical protein
LVLGCLLGVGALLWNGSIAIPDEGVYLAQTDLLRNGSWSGPAPAPDIDINGSFTPVAENGAVDGRVVPYSKHPLYPLLLAPAFAIDGYKGVLVLSALGTWAAAVAAAFIARRIRPAYGPWALWIVGVGSPLLFDAYIAVAHSLAAAAAGIAFLGVTRAVDDRRWVHLAYGLPAVAATVALRGEGLIFGVALGLGTALAAVGWPPFRRLNWQPALAGAAVLGVSAITYVVNSASTSAIRSETLRANPASRLSSDQLDIWGGVWASLLRPFAATWATANPFLPLAVISVILAAIVLRFAPTFVLLPLGLLVMSALAALASLLAPPELITGLVPAFPVLVAGLLLLRADALRLPIVVRAVSTAALTAGALLAVNYSVGGASEWGGRFFHILIPVMVPVALAGLDSGRAALSGPQGRVAGACLVTVTLVLSLSSLRTQLSLRNDTRSIVTEAVRLANSPTSDAAPLILVARLYGDGVSRFFWEQSDEVDVLTLPSIQLLPAALAQARTVGRQHVVVVTNISPPTFSLLFQANLDDLGWEVTEVTSDEDGDPTWVTLTAAR